MKQGFTLLELMVVMLITTVIGGALFMSMSSGRTSWHEANTQISIQEELRRAMRQMVSDLSQAGFGQINISANSSAVYDSVSFNVSMGINNATGNLNWSSSPINYTLSGGQILKNQGGNSSVLANNVTALNFYRYLNSTRIVRMNVTVQKSTPYGRTLNASMSEAVYLRN